MFKVFVWSTLAATAGAASMFVPIDPALLGAVGLHDTDATVAPIAAETSERAATHKSTLPIKIVSRGTAAADKTAIRVFSAPATSPYRAATTAPTKDVAAKPSRVKQLAIATPSTLAAPQPVTPATYAMVRNLQNELRRVGCYHGRIDGDWGPASRFAMAAFTKKVNATLPTDRPDIVLLALVRRHSGAACGGLRATPTPAPTITAAAPAPQTGPQRVSAWRTRIDVAPATASKSFPRTRTVRPAAQSGPSRLVGIPRIVRADGVVASRATRVPPSDAGATTFAAAGVRSGAFDRDSRMSLGVIPAPNEAVRPTTRTPRGWFGHGGTQRPFAQRRRADKPRARARRSVKRRRYYRRSRSVSWRKRAFKIEN
ncbi:MAG: peptidoglycan-binding domain-containing protein [Hyphomicrobiaceae bacterium]